MSARDDHPAIAEMADPANRKGWGPRGEAAEQVLDEMDRLRAELDEVRTVVPADFFDALDAVDASGADEEAGAYRFFDHGGKAVPEGTPYGVVRTALRTRQVDITGNEDVRANQRRLVELDDAGNVVVEYVEKRP